MRGRKAWENLSHTQRQGKKRNQTEEEEVRFLIRAVLNVPIRSSDEILRFKRLFLSAIGTWCSFVRPCNLPLARIKPYGQTADAVGKNTLNNDDGSHNVLSVNF